MVTRWWRVLAAVVLAGLGLGLGGCAGGNSVTLRSGATPAVLEPVLSTVVYAPVDDNTADIYLTDLTRRELDGSIEAERVSGSIVHIHLFITPTPGKTPLDPGACSAVVRYVVLARGEVGIYGGGGFLRPSARPGASVLGGEIRDASLRLVGATEGFQDLLGPAILQGSFRAPRDEGMSRLIAARLERATERAGRVDDAAPAPVVGP